jgi:hypothetical protein
VMRLALAGLPRIVAKPMRTPLPSCMPVSSSNRSKCKPAWRANLTAP